MKQFMYKKVTNPDTEELNRLGQEGWELVAVVPFDPQNFTPPVYVFKIMFTSKF